jgi:hypothetical protein
MSDIKIAISNDVYKQLEPSFPRWLPAACLIKGEPLYCRKELSDCKHEEGAYSNFEHIENKHGYLYTIFSCCPECHEQLVELIDQWASIELKPILEIFPMVEQSKLK